MNILGLAAWSEPAATLQRVDLSAARRVFVVGDVHGHFTRLRAALQRVGFSPREGDHLLQVGDLTDRGPESEQAVRWVTQPWFWAVRGNHEVMLWDHSRGRAQDHLVNGGEWFTQLPQEQRRLTADALMRLPVAMEVLCPSGKRVGLVHADYPTADWGEVEILLKDSSAVTKMLWARTRIQKILAGQPPGYAVVRGIDHLYMGHTPLSFPVTVGNSSWIDTGVYKGGEVALILVDSASVVT